MAKKSPKSDEYGPGPFYLLHAVRLLRSTATYRSLSDKNKSRHSYWSSHWMIIWPFYDAKRFALPAPGNTVRDAGVLHLGELFDLAYAL